LNEHDLQYIILKNNLNKGPVKNNNFTGKRSLNTIGWELKREVNEDEKLS
jgi:hypothetical protein